MQKKIMALFAMLALILTTLVMTSSATATGSVSQSGGDKDCTWEWSRTIPGVDGVKEYTFERDVPKTKTQYKGKYQKYVARQHPAKKTGPASWDNATARLRLRGRWGPGRHLGRHRLVQDLTVVVGRCSAEHSVSLARTMTLPTCTTGTSARSALRTGTS